MADLDPAAIMADRFIRSHDTETELRHFFYKVRDLARDRDRLAAEVARLTEALAESERQAAKGWSHVKLANRNTERRTQQRDEARAEVSRLLEQERRVREQAWDEGFTKAGRLLTGLDHEDWPPTPNPYRTALDGDSEGPTVWDFTEPDFPEIDDSSH